MPISLTVSNESADLVLADLQRLFPSLVAGTQLPPMQEQPRENREPLPESNVKEIEPAPVNTRGTRRTKPKEDAKAPEGEPSSENTTTKEEKPAAVEQSTEDDSSKSPSAPDTSTVPDIDDLRARLKTLGATEGFGHDKVFEVLGKYDAKNASTVPETKRAACIAEIDEMLKGSK